MITITVDWVAVGAAFEPIVFALGYYWHAGFLFASLVWVFIMGCALFDDYDSDTCIRASNPFASVVFVAAWPIILFLILYFFIKGSWNGSNT